MHHRPEALRIKEPLDSFRLDREDYWKGVGNTALLAADQRFVSLRISRKCTPEMIEKIAARMAKAADQGFVIISGFISPGERAVCDMLAKRAGAKNAGDCPRRRVVPARKALDFAARNMI